MNRSPSLHNNLEAWRVTVFAVVGVLIFSVYIGRLFTLQVIENAQWLERAEDNRTDEVNTPAPRGILYDRNGTILARNIASYNVVVTASLLPDDEGATQEIFRELSRLTGMPVNRGNLETTPYVPCEEDLGIAQIVEYGQTATPYDPVRIICDIDSTQALIIQEKAVDLPGVSVEVQPIRDYPTGSITSTVIGFMGPIPAVDEDYYTNLGLVPNRDKVGYSGIELALQDILGGKNGLREIEVDVAGKEVRDIAPPVHPKPGYNVRLTLDVRLQKAAEEIFKQELESWNRIFPEPRYTSGVVIAINPKTGEILSMVSWPTYENNRMARFIPGYYFTQLSEDPANPLMNHAVGDNLPAGSVFKLVTGVGALNEGVVTPEQIIETPPKLIVSEKFAVNQQGGEREFVDWNEAGFGQLDFIGGLSNSSNVYFYKLGGGFEDEVPEGLGICRLGTYARALGYGAEPETGLPYEARGLIPDPKWKRITHGEGWSTGDTYIVSVGQGYVVATPLQVLMSAATIANDGKLMQPTLVREVTDADGNIVPLWRTEEFDYLEQPAQGAIQVSPFQPHMKWDITQDNLIEEFFDTTIQGCEPTGGHKNVDPWVIEKMQEGMRRAVTHGTLSIPAVGFEGWPIAAAGKTGTAEYCDKYAQAKDLCKFGRWPSHAWTVAYAPYEDPEIAVVAFVYNGGEGASVAGPIVRRVLQAYFSLKSIDISLQTP
jgi:penicillin-binding protein 2